MPSKLPTTSVPTKAGVTLIPTVLPTSAPTYNLKNYKTDSGYLAFQSNSNYFSSKSNLISFSTFYYKKEIMFGDCSAWSTFTDTDLFLPLDTLYFTQLQGIFYYYDFAAKSTKKLNTTCSDSSKVALIISALQTGQSKVVSCSGDDWRVLTCSSYRMLCVNCKDTCNPSVSCPGTSFSINSCGGSCSAYASASSSIGFSYGVKILYPIVNEIVSVTPYRNSVTITANITGEGYFFCSPFSSGSTPESTADFQGFKEVISSNLTTVTIDGLYPDTDYDIYCYTQDYLKHVMPIDVILTSKNSIHTSCCRKLSLPVASSAIFEYFSGTTRPEFQYQVKYDAIPTRNLKLSISLTAVKCSASSKISTSSVATSYPSSISVYSNTTSLQSPFVVRGTQGCYNMSIKATGSDYYQPMWYSLVIQSINLPPSSPVLLNASLSDDGSRVLVNFDSSTDYGVTIYPLSYTFNCSNVFKFRGAPSLTCSWLSSSQVQFVVGGASSAPSINSSITLLSGIIRPACIPNTDCTRAKYSVSQTISVSAPSSPVTPSVVLLSSPSVSSCSDISIDLSKSTGNGGKDWSKLTWKVSGSFSDENKTIVENYLNAHYSSSTTIAKVPSSTLFAGNVYYFALQLTNWLGKSGVSSCSVSVTHSLGTPNVVIASSSIVNVLRSQVVSLTAQANIPKCSGLSLGITFSWKVFQGIKYLSAIKSTSIDPRNFVVPSYSFNASSTYTVQVTASAQTGSTVNTPMSSASIVLVVGQSGVKASIIGGSTRSVDRSVVNVFDGSSSYDIDYPASALSFVWSCQEYYPSFGKSCPFVPTSTSVLSIPASTLVTAHSYTLSLKVTNSRGLSDTSTCVITVFDQGIPGVTIAPISTKYNANQKIVLSGTIVATSDVSVYWYNSNIPNFSNSSILGTPSSTQLSAGTSVFQLSLLPNFLNAGSSYVFSLNAKYLRSSGSKKPSLSSTSVTLVMNQPPVGGSLVVSPSSGLALNTSFLMIANSWSDDPADYPLGYIFSYYTLYSTYSTVLRPLSVTSVANVYIGQGLSSLLYYVTCVVEASDIYGATSNATTPVKVSPILGLSSLASALAKTLTSATISQDPVAISQAVTAATSTLNVIDCTVPVTCSSLNRQQCMNTPKTCGPCNTGYSGPSGDSNTMCVSLQTLSAKKGIGEICSLSSDCISGLCNTTYHTCSDTLKTCPNSCSRRGTCTYTDAVSGETITSCYSSNMLCQASCTCNKGSYGRDCSYTLSQIISVRAIRESLCLSSYSSLKYQDVSSDVVLSRASSIANILLDLTQVTDAALSNCTAVLVDTVNNYPDLAGSSSVAPTVVSALSNVLKKGTSLSSSLLSDVNSALQALSLGSIATMAVGESPTELSTDLLRVQTSIASARSLSGSSFAPPLSPYENATGARVPSLALNLSFSPSGSAAVGVTVVQYNNNPQGTKTNSTPISLQTSMYDVSTTSVGRRRLNSDMLSRDLGSKDVDVVVSLPNPYPIEYPNLNATTVIVLCGKVLDTSYHQNITCPNGYVVNMICPPGGKGRFNISCPGFITQPQCLTWNGDSFQPDSNCELVSFSSSSTVCKCGSALPSSQNKARRNLASGQSSVMQFSSSMVLMATEFAMTWKQAPPLTVVTRNKVIVGTLSGVLGFGIAGLFLFGYIDKLNMDSRKSKASNAKEGSVKKRSIKGYFDQLLPKTLTDGKWYAVFWEFLLKEHPFIALFAPFDPDEPSKIATFVLFICEIVVFIFMDTIVAGIYFSDNGECEAISNESICVNMMTAGHLTYTCQWNSDNLSCSFKPPTLDPIALLMFSAVVTIISMPIMQLLRSMTYRIFPYRSSVKPWLAKGDNGDFDNICDTRFHNDEFSLVQTKRSKILRAARLEKAQKTMDFLLPSEEALLVLRQAETENVHFRNNKIVSDSKNNIVFESLHYGFKDSSKTSVLEWIKAARKEANLMRNEMEYMESSEDKERYLIQNFIVFLFSGPQREIARRHFLGDFQSVRLSRWRTTLRLLSSIVLPAVILIMIFYVYIFNLSIGSKASHMWMAVAGISLLQNMIINIPLMIFMRRIVVVASIAMETRRCLDIMKERSKIILIRTSGVLRDSNALVQHFNPACRAARMFPELPISRLLMSFGDNDLPLKDNITVFRISYFLFFGLFIFLAYLPDDFQDSIFDVIVSCFGGAISTGVLYFINSNTLGASLLIIFFFLILFLREGVVFSLNWKKLKEEDKVKNNALFYTIDNDDFEDDKNSSRQSENSDELSKEEELDIVAATPAKLKPGRTGSANGRKLVATMALESPQGELSLEFNEDNGIVNVDPRVTFERNITPMETLNSPSKNVDKRSPEGGKTLLGLGDPLLHLPQLSGPPLNASPTRIVGEAIPGKNYELHNSEHGQISPHFADISFFNEKDVSNPQLQSSMPWSQEDNMTNTNVLAELDTPYRMNPSISTFDTALDPVSEIAEVSRVRKSRRGGNRSSHQQSDRPFTSPNNNFRPVNNAMVNENDRNRGARRQSPSANARPNTSFMNPVQNHMPRAHLMSSTRPVTPVNRIQNPMVNDEWSVDMQDRQRIQFERDVEDQNRVENRGDRHRFQRHGGRQRIAREQLAPVMSSSAGGGSYADNFRRQLENAPSNGGRVRTQRNRRVVRVNGNYNDNDRVSGPINGGSMGPGRMAETSFASFHTFDTSMDQPSMMSASVNMMPMPNEGFYNLAGASGPGGQSDGFDDVHQSRYPMWQM